MSVIVAARFNSFPSASSAAHALFAEGLPESAVSIFYDEPRQHGHPAAAARDGNTGRAGLWLGAIAGSGLFAMAGALLGAWAAFELQLQEITLIGATAAGAYLGSLAGAAWILSRLWRECGAAVNRTAAVLLTVQVKPEQESAVAALLRDADGRNMARAKGLWNSVPTEAPMSKGKAARPRRVQWQL